MSSKCTKSIHQWYSLHDTKNYQRIKFGIEWYKNILNPFDVFYVVHMMTCWWTKFQIEMLKCKSIQEFKSYMTVYQLLTKHSMMDPCKCYKMFVLKDVHTWQACLIASICIIQVQFEYHPCETKCTLLNYITKYLRSYTAVLNSLNFYLLRGGFVVITLSLFTGKWGMEMVGWILVVGVSFFEFFHGQKWEWGKNKNTRKC